QVHHQK
nr:RecName: Full=Male-attracting factor; AltName: Full=Sm-MAF [Schistosoma mansoni]